MSQDNNDQNIISDEDSIIDHDIITDINILASVFGIPLETHNIGRVRRREEIVEDHFKKIFKDASGNPIIFKNIDYYIKLKSGEELFFTKDDGKDILLNEQIEPSRLIRNIISKVPFKMTERLKFLSKFIIEDNTEKLLDTAVLRDILYKAYILEFRLRFLFKRLLNIWRVHKLDKTSKQQPDPITFSLPEKEVHIYDWSNRKKFTADAKSLANYIETKLMYNEYGFPVPMYPKNPFNNTDLSYKQMISIYNQLKTHGELKWAFTTFREYNFNKHRWHIYHKSALTMNAIKSSIILLDSIEAHELFSDFIFSKMDELNIPSSAYIIRAYKTAIIKIPNHWFLEKFKSLAISYYEAEHFGHNRQRAINSSCLRFFRKQNDFLKYLEDKKII